MNASLSTEEHTDSSSKSQQSSQEVLKTQLQTLIDAALTSKNAPQVLTQLKPYFENISDLPFLINSATNLCQHNLTYKPILYLLQKKAFPTSDEKSIHLINDLMIKVDLLDYILFSRKNCYENVNIIQQNYKELLVTFISKSDLDLASICWLKYSEMKLKISPSDVIDILNAIPQNIKMGGLFIWLRNFVPCLLDENPYFIDIFVNWTIQRVFSFEKSPYWPKLGLKFIDEIINVLNSSMKTVPVRPISMDNLDSLKDHIHYIIELKEKFNIAMSLREISSMSPSEAALTMLRRCYAEDLSTFLQDFLLAYAMRYLFDMDDILSTVIKTEAANCGGGVNSSRLKILLNAFRSISLKLECLLQVLKVLDVPWDDTVLDLAIAAAASVFNDFTITETDRVLAHEIQKELNYAKVKVVLKKYNIPLNCTDYSLVLHKLINTSAVNLNDLRVITSVLNSYTNFGNILYIDRCLRDCEIRAALEYFTNLSNQERRILLKTILNKFEQIISGNTSSSLVERNYIDFLKGTTLLNEIQINNIENLYHLKNSYDISMDFNIMYNENICAQKTASWIKSDQVTASSGRGHCLHQLTRTHQSRQSELVSLLRRTSTSGQVRKLIESLISLFCSSEKSFAEDIVSLLSNLADGVNSSVLLESFGVLIDLVARCSEELLHYLMKYLSVLNALINGTIIVKNLAVAWKFHYIFLPMSSVTAINELIPFYANSLAEDSVNEAHLNVKNKNDFIIFRILGASYDILSDELRTTKRNAARRLITKVITCQDLDEILLTTLLLMLSEAEKPEDSTWIVDILQSQNESMPPVILRYLSSPLICNLFALENILSGNVVSYSPQYIIKSKFNINLTDIALSDNTEETWDVKVVLFYVLRMYLETTFERLVELCRTLNISVNDGLSLQLIALLTTWELKYKTYKDNLGCRQLYFENNEKDLMAKCFTIWNSISDKNFLKNILTDFWKTGESTLHGRSITINPYYYEVYICIFHLIYGSSVEMRSKKEYFLLNFLKDYRRKSTPKQYEFELFSIKGIFPEIGYHRLPFHLFMREDMWSNLKCEITLETYERWLSAVALLSLDPEVQTAKDMICSNALKQSMTARKRNEKTDNDSKDSGPWQITTKEEPLLHAAHRCLRHIVNMDWTGACLFYILQGLARGADQVAAAQLSYQFAQRWAAQQPDNRAARQMERLHFTLSTRHALHKIEWTCEEFVRLVAEPAQLIRALYLHPEFVEKMARYDVNRTADEIADKNGINISSIRFQILENVLSTQSEENKSNDASGLDTKTLMVAKYILKAACPKMSAIYLSRIVFDDESDFNKCKKLRALQCLMSVVDLDTALKVTNKDRDALWPLLLELLYTVKLEDIDMPWLVAMFAQDKTLALEQLLQTVSGSVEGLIVTADLARRYGSVKHIRDLLPLLLRAGLYEEMIPSLLKIFTPPDDIIYTAWKAVILSPFQRADYPITERQKAKCLKVMNLLPLCPVIKDEDLIEVWKNCLRCKCIGLGCLVLPYITPEKRQTISELYKIDKRKLIASLKNLHSETYLVSGAMLVVESLTSRPYR